MRIQKAFGGVSDELSDLGQALEEAEVRSEQMQARAAAIDQLVEDGILHLPGSTAASPIERRLDQLEIEQAVDVELAKLKRELANPLD